MTFTIDIDTQPKDRTDPMSDGWTDATIECNGRELKTDRKTEMLLCDVLKRVVEENE